MGGRIDHIQPRAFNARVRPDLNGPPSQDQITKWMNWAEDPADEPLPVGLFTDEPSFNQALNVWLAAFLAGLGIAVPDLSVNNMNMLRRVASRYYAVFEYDVEHSPIFELIGDRLLARPATELWAQQPPSRGE